MVRDNLSLAAVKERESIVTPEASKEFVQTSCVKEITERSMAYLKAGYSIHFAGPAGTGKTTMAFHIASLLGRSVTLMHGDDEFGTSDLIGQDVGYHKYRLVDNYIHSVLKTEEEVRSVWMNSRLTNACQNGDTLIYDEFNRSRPEANNVLLSVLSERILNMPKLRRNGESYIEVHPDFRAIFTSNPEEYAGVHKTQDALMDRIVTINIGHYDRETEVSITQAKSRLNRKDAEIIVDLVRDLRISTANNYRPTIRSCIMMAKVLAQQNARPSLNDPIFKWVSRDVLNYIPIKTLEEVLARVCQSRN
jgi:nitric oxide reductase NorQ protein